MARVSPKNPRYRSKEEICRDVAFVISCETLHIGTRLAVVDQVFWVWTEFDGKYDGCKYWSKKAKALPKGEAKGNLVHEHLVPRKVVRQKLLRCKSANDVRTVLETWCIGVVVTREEDQLLNSLRLGSAMPHDWDGIDPWARYTKAGIRLAQDEASAC